MFYSSVAVYAFMLKYAFVNFHILIIYTLSIKSRIFSGMGVITLSISYCCPSFSLTF